MKHSYRTCDLCGVTGSTPGLWRGTTFLKNRKGVEYRYEVSWAFAGHYHGCDLCEDCRKRIADTLYEIFLPALMNAPIPREG